MKLEVHSVKNQGDAKKEYVLLLAKEDCNIGSFFIVDNTYDNSGQPSNKLRHTYFFPSTTVKKGHYVVLYTTSGKNGTGTVGNVPCHIFYWGLGNSVWNDTGDIVHLIEISNISKHRVTPKA